MAVVQADGNIEVVKSELAEFARAVAGNDDLHDSLSNRLLPAATRGQIVDDLLGGRSSDTTRALVGMIVTSGRGGQLSEIVDQFIIKAAADSGRCVATVRTAVPLTADQQTRLAAALKTQTGNDVELQVVVDATVVGGAVTTIGDAVIDGSLRTRLNKMRSRSSVGASNLSRGRKLTWHFRLIQPTSLRRYRRTSIRTSPTSPARVSVESSKSATASPA